MTIYGVPHRVACYVTRQGDLGRELLVFEHLGDEDSNPADPSGVQIPAGGMAPFEQVETAAEREVEEESGLCDVTFERQLGAVELGLHEPGGPSVTTYVELTAPGGGEQHWRHTVSGDGDDAGMTFCWRWEPLPLAFPLAGGQAVYLDQLSGLPT